MPTENVISVVCSCGKRLKAPASAAGKKARCPACSNVVVLSSAPTGVTPVTAAPRVAAPVARVAAATPPPPPPQPESDDPFGALYELAEQAKPAAASAAVTTANVCPQCRSTMADSAVLCTNCGYDTRTGKSLASATAGPAAAGPVLNYRGAPTPAKKPPKPVDYMAPDGSLVMGVVLSAVFALIASSVWIGVAWATGLTIGYIAILIGIGAGVGMQIGHRGYSKAGGVIASFMTIIAIIIAKIIVLELILSRDGKSISDIDGSRLGLYFFSPIGLIIIAVGVGAAFRTANGSSSTN
jgi:hypothetical protein